MNPQKIQIFDTCVFVHFLRNNNTAAINLVTDVINGNLEAGISVITDMELWVGARTNNEEQRIKALLAKFRRFQFNVTIARRTGVLARPFFLNSKAVPYPDLIIAATAEYYKADLRTKNIKDFQPLPLHGVQVISF